MTENDPNTLPESAVLSCLDGSGTFLDDEKAVAQLLDAGVLFVNARRFMDLNGAPREETLVLFVCCNDLFYWGTADGESLPMDELRPLYEMWRADPEHGSLQWCCRRRQLRPQVPIVKAWKAAGVWTDEMEALPAPMPS